MELVLKYLNTLSLNLSFEGKKILDSTTDLSFLILRLKQSLKEEEISLNLDSKSKFKLYFSFNFSISSLFFIDSINVLNLISVNNCFGDLTPFKTICNSSLLSL